MMMSVNGDVPVTRVEPATWRVAELATLRALVTPLEQLARLVLAWRECVTQARLLRIATGTPATVQRDADDAATRAEHYVFLHLDALLRDRQLVGASEPPGEQPVRTVIADPTVAERRLLRYSVRPDRVLALVALACGAVAKDDSLADRERHDVLGMLATHQHDMELLLQGNTEVTIHVREEER